MPECLCLAAASGNRNRTRCGSIQVNIADNDNRTFFRQSKDGARPIPEPAPVTSATLLTLRELGNSLTIRRGHATLISRLAPGHVRNQSTTSIGANGSRNAHD